MRNSKHNLTLVYFPLPPPFHNPNHTIVVLNISQKKKLQGIQDFMELFNRDFLAWLRLCTFTHDKVKCKSYLNKL